MIRFTSKDNIRIHCDKCNTIVDKVGAGGVSLASACQSHAAKVHRAFNKNDYTINGQRPE